MIQVVAGDPPRLRLQVRVQPRASRTRVVGLHGDALRIQIAAPPVDGAANQALIDLLAATLGLPRAAVRLVGGEKGRSKVVEIDASDVDEVRRRLGMPAPTAAPR